MNPMLQIDPDALRQFLLLYLETMRDLQKQIMVYRTVVELLKKENPDLIETLVQKAGENPELNELSDEMHQKLVSAVNQSIEQGFRGQVLSKFLQEWKAKGSIN
jgi:non-homologous end joining protein Ku